MTQLRGFLERWDDGKGFGFIFHVDYPKGVFIHISAFKRNISRRPVVGDMIIYELFVDMDGKRKAVNAQIESVSAANTTKKKSSNKTNYHRNAKQKSSSSLLTLLVFLGIAIFIAFKYQQTFNKPTVQTTKATPASVIGQPVITPRQQFSCQGKTYCSQMSSCEEAQFYQNNCSGTKMDGDGDGIPCEDQWCGH